MASRTKVVVGLGELLWDFLPGGKQLGGAPANFAHAARLLGCESLIASRIGTDELGRDATARLSKLALTSDYVQEDPSHSTGRVNVSLDRDGHPNFEIVEPVAWDFLEFSDAWRNLAQLADAVCFGSLAQRSERSQTTIQQFLKTMRPDTIRVYDVNLRQSFYSLEVISASLQIANIVKLNEHELPIVANLMGMDSGDEKSAAQKLCDAFDLDLVCVTRGEHGSLLLRTDAVDQHPGFATQVIDTVGAGDAFIAGLIHEHLQGATLHAMNDTANRMGAWVSSQAGGMPIPLGSLEPILMSFDIRRPRRE